MIKRPKLSGAVTIHENTEKHMSVYQIVMLLFAGAAATGGQLSITKAYTKAVSYTHLRSSVYDSVFSASNPFFVHRVFYISKYLSLIHI